MALSIAIAAIQQFAFLSFLIDSSFFMKTASDDSRALMFAIALFSAILSVPAIAWNVTMVRSARIKRNVIPTVISALTLVCGVTYLVFAFVSRVHRIGLTLF